MLIKDVATATEQARRIIGNPPKSFFKPREGRREGSYWIVTAITGIIDNIEVTVKIPERLLDV